MTPEKEPRGRRAEPDSARRGRGRPRSEEAHRAILAAVVELLPEHGLKGLTIEAVAARAGVGKTTIYRRWKTKNELIVEAIEQLRPPGPAPDTGTFRGDLDAMVDLQRERLEASQLPRMMPRVLGEASEDPDLHAEIVTRAVLPIRALLAQIVRQGVERGELRPELDLELATDIVHGTVVYRILARQGDLLGATAAVPQVLDLMRSQ